jgi:hypothetical protein
MSTSHELLSIVKVMNLHTAALNERARGNTVAAEKETATVCDSSHTENVVKMLTNGC